MGDAPGMDAPFLSFMKSSPRMIAILITKNSGRKRRMQDLLVPSPCLGNHQISPETTVASRKTESHKPNVTSHRIFQENLADMD
jgi:hypothetical protein